MKTKSLVIVLASCLFFVNLCYSAAAWGGARIDLTVGHGVEREAEAQARLAVNAAFDFFQKTYGLGLERDIRILIASDKQAYGQDLKRWYNLNETQAVILSEASLGLQQHGTITVNLGDIHNSYGQFFVLCHEIVHHFQNQESRGRHSAIRWVTEGVADALAAHILATAGVKGAADYKNRWQEVLNKARDWPKLENLHTPQEWFAAIAAYGAEVTYKTAGMAVLTLVRWKGYRPLFTYFSALKQAGPEDAFHQAFGVKINDFEKQFHPF